MTKKTTAVHLAYTDIDAPRDEYRRAMHIALAGGDPRVAMSEEARKLFDEIKNQHHKHLPGRGDQLRKTLRTIGSIIRSRDVVGPAALVSLGLVTQDICLFFEAPTTTSRDRFVLSRTYFDVLYDIFDTLRNERKAREVNEETIVVFRDYAHVILTDSPDSEEYRDAKSELIMLTDYLKEK